MRLAKEYRIGKYEFEYSACDPDPDDACMLFF